MAGVTWVAARSRGAHVSQQSGVACSAALITARTWRPQCWSHPQMCATKSLQQRAPPTAASTPPATAFAQWPSAARKRCDAGTWCKWDASGGEHARSFPTALARDHSHCAGGWASLCGCRTGRQRQRTGRGRCVTQTNCLIDVHHEILAAAPHRGVRRCRPKTKRAAAIRARTSYNSESP